MVRCGFLSLCMGVWMTANVMSISMDVSFRDQALDCCVKLSHHPILKRMAACYRNQRTGDGCSISAVVMISVGA